MIANFGLERVNDSPASFDPNKLYWLAGEYMKLLPTADKVAGCVPFLARAGLVAEPLDDATRTRLAAVVEGCGDRLKLFSDILPYGSPFCARIGLRPEGGREAAEEAGRGRVAPRLPRHPRGGRAVRRHGAGEGLHEFCTAKGVKLGDMVHPVRVATTGAEVGFGLFETLAVLGRAAVLRRIDRALTF